MSGLRLLAAVVGLGVEARGGTRHGSHRGGALGASHVLVILGDAHPQFLSCGLDSREKTLALIEGGGAVHAAGNCVVGTLGHAPLCNVIAVKLAEVDRRHGRGLLRLLLRRTGQKWRGRSGLRVVGDGLLRRQLGLGLLALRPIAAVVGDWRGELAHGAPCFSGTGKARCVPTVHGPCMQ